MDLLPPFVGKSRHLLVEGLLNIFDQVNETCEARVVSLEAPSGWGKTRIIQEFYARLAKRQKKQYWPDSIFDLSTADLLSVDQRRNRVFPESKTFQREAGALPEFMWLGITCAMRSGVPSQVLLEDLQQFDPHVAYFETAWAALASFKEKRYPTLEHAKVIMSNIKEEVASQGVTKIVEALAEVSVPGVGMFLKLTRWGIDEGKQTYQTNKMIREGGGLEEKKNDDLIGDIINTIRKMAVNGLPMVVFVEDLHYATPLMEELIEELSRLNAAVLIVTTTWPGESEDNSVIRKIQNNPITASRLIRVQHHEPPTADFFPQGAGLNELSPEDMAEIILSYYPNADQETVERLSARYNNPYPLELVCSLPKYQRRFGNGNLHLSKEEIDKLPNTVKKIYQELWESLPEAVRQALALATLAIPNDYSSWHDPLVQKAIQVCDHLYDKDEINEAFGKQQYTHGWSRVIEKWLRRFNEPDQYQIAKEEVYDLFNTEEIERYLDELAKPLKELVFENGDSKDQYHAWMILSFHKKDRDNPEKEPRINDETVLKAIRLLQKSHRHMPKEIKKSIELGELIATLNVAPDSTEILDARFDYAATLGHFNQKKSALEEFESLLSEQKRILAPNHIDILHTRANIAYWTAESGQAATALEQFKGLLRDQNRIIGPDHPDTLRIRHNVAYWTAESGHIPEALEQFQELLHDQERIIGPDHPVFLSTRHNIAAWMAETGQIEAALVQFKRLFRDQERILGTDNPEILTTRNSIAHWTREFGQISTAGEHYKELLSEQKRVLGPDHPNILKTRYRIAYWTLETGQLEAALEQFERLLNDQERILGPDHPDILTTRDDIALLIETTGQVAKAVKQLEVQLNEQKRTLGPDHPNTLTTRHNIALWTAKSEQIEAALELFDKLLSDQERILRPDHPDILTTQGSIAIWTLQSGQLEAALELFENLLNNQMQILGPNHPDILNTRYNIAYLLEETEQHDASAQQLEKLSDDQNRILGPGHPDTLALWDKIIAWDEDFE